MIKKIVWGEKFSFQFQISKPFYLGLELASKKINWFLYVSIMSMRMGIDQRDWIEKVKKGGTRPNGSST